MSWLKELYAQQTTPDEVVIFLLLGTFLTLMISFLAYAIVLIALSKWRMNVQHSLWSLLFPSAKRIRKYAAEYLLGIVTAVLLGLTVSAKHNAVEAVLAQDIEAIGQDIVRSALPLGRLETEELVTAGASQESAEQLVSWLDEGVAVPVSKTADEIVRPLLAAGMSESANLIVREAVKIFGAGSSPIVSQGVILAVAISLLIGYVVWFSVQRWQEMQKEQARDPSYAAIMKRLSLPAVCIPLLFVSAVAMENQDRLADSVIGYASVSEAPPETSLGAVISDQAEAVRSGALTVRAEDIEQVNARLATLDQQIAESSSRLSTVRNTVRDLGNRLGSVETSLSSVSSQADSLSDTVNGFRAELLRVERQAKADSDTATTIANQAMDEARGLSNTVAGLEQRINGMQQTLSGLSAEIKTLATHNGVLLVISNVGNRSYVVRRGTANGQIVARGSDVGLHALPPDRYWVTSGGQGKQAVLRSDTAASTYFPYVVE